MCELLSIFRPPRHRRRGYHPAMTYGYLPPPPAKPKPRTPRKQQGYVLLLTLITLVVLLFGVLFTMRGTLLQALATAAMALS